MKHQNFLAIFAVLLALISGCQTPTPDAPAYDGTRPSFTKFITETGVDWPPPETVNWYNTSDGAKIRYAFWPASDANPSASAGVVVFFSGRTEFIEKNIYTYRDLQERNYDVWTFDWRGQGLSDRLLPDKPHLGHIDTFDTYIRDAEQFIEQIVKLSDYTDGHKILMAHSMGGAIATRYLQVYQNQFDLAALSSPMHGLPWSALLLNKLQLLGDATSCAGGWFGSCQWQNNVKPYVQLCDFETPVSVSSFKSPHRAHSYSHDYAKLRQRTCVIEAESKGGVYAASLGLGRPTIGWLRQAILFTNDIHEHADELQTPTLIVGGGKDRIVSNSAQVGFCEKAGNMCQREELPGASHEIFIEIEEFRESFFEHFDEFVDNRL